MGVPISTLHPSGFDLFSVAENFLTDLSAEDESMISGGGGCKSKSKKSKKKSKSKSCGCGSYC
ncbi:MAG: hypothetical protein KME49_03630 [Brasilonema octagenarum HA4186-MV1]|jgi:hypothetical protein|nr:hypothetical protein [Brasilonema octagenarum HA4186-MV1]